MNDRDSMGSVLMTGVDDLGMGVTVSVGGVDLLFGGIGRADMVVGVVGGNIPERYCLDSGGRTL